MSRRLDRYTAHHHLRAAAGQGVVAGVFLLNEYVARKDLGATRWHVLALLLVPALAQFFAAVWNPADPRRLLGRRPFRVLGMGAHLVLLPLLLVPALHGATPFVLVLVLAATAQTFLIPIQNATLARNYLADTRGRSFGAASAVQALAIMVVSWPAGMLLDRHPASWPVLYAGAALAAAFGYAHWGRLRRRRPPPPPVGLIEAGSPFQALARDRTFLAFEACFMVYGIGFLAMQPVLPLYLVDELNVSYSQVGAARGFVFWVAFMLAGPVAGRLSDRFGILRIAAGGYAVLAGFPLLLLALPAVGAGLLYPAFAVYGFAMGFVHLAWNLGPIALARGGDPLPYLNAHLALVGVRALIGMVGGTLLFGIVGSRPIFAGVVVCEILAAAGMYATARASGRRWRVGDTQLS